MVLKSNQRLMFSLALIESVIYGILSYLKRQIILQDYCRALSVVSFDNIKSNAMFGPVNTILYNR